MERCKILIAGYIRSVGKIIPKVIIPKVINNVCISYYFVHNHEFFYVWFYDKNAHDPHQLKSLNLYTKDKQVFNINSTNKTQMDNRAYYGMHYASNKSIPKYISETYTNALWNTSDKYCSYNMIFRVGGGSVSNPSGICEVIIWDMSELQQLTNDNKYIRLYTLPSLNSGLGSPSVTYLRNIVFVVGGNTNQQSRLSSDIYALDLNEKHSKNWLRITNQTKLIQPRYASSLMFIDYNKLLVIAGCSHWAKACDTMELYQFDNMNNCMLLKSLNHKRAFTECCKGVGNDNNKIVIGGGLLGGDSAAKTIEIYDVVKDIWTLFPHQTIYSHQKGSVWVDEYDRNILYIAGSRYGAHSDLSEIEWIDIRDGKSWKLFISNTTQLMGIKRHDSIISYCA